MLTPLDPRHVRLLSGPFADARDRNAVWLLALDPKHLLHGFYQNAGLPTCGDAYGGWEQQSLAGHSLGHYLSACVRLAAAGDERFAERVSLILAELKRCQEARSDGFIGGMPDADRVFGELRAGIVRARNFDLNDCWVPWYNLHKLFAGLLDAATLLPRPPHPVGGRGELALEIVTKLADWAIGVTATLDDAQWQAMLGCEFGGMNESLAELYALTGEARYLELAEKFYHHAVLDPLAEGVDCLPGLHGNTQIPKIIGCARLYEVTGDEKYRKIAENFWRFVTQSHSYVIGGHGSGEHFGPTGDLSARLTHSTCETCNSYNMLKLTEHLFCWESKAEYGDFMEKVRINHILASQNPEDGMVCYFVSLLSGHFKHYSTPEDSFWCCVGTGWENHTRYGDGVYFADAEHRVLYVTQLVASEVHLPEWGLTVCQETPFPESETVRFTVTGPQDIAVRLRLPTWAGYSAIRWRDIRSDELVFRKKPAIESLLGAPDKLALLDGPMVLAADLGAAPPPGDADGGEPFNAQIPPAPVLLDPVSRTFEREGISLVPFYKLHGRRQAVYFDSFTNDEWAEKEVAYRATETQAHNQRTKQLDEFWPNQMQPERDHHFAGEGFIGGERSAWKFRQAEENGWFSFTLRSLPDSPLDLECLWGPPQDHDVRFTVEVEEQPIVIITKAVEKHRHLAETYWIPEHLTNGKDRVTVRISGPSAPLFRAKLQKRLEA
ncbi:beta-L-arabinofuranosidase domain-containing protein [Armatimonas sp.]|uniref:beta-L-arabinofuranosidase domain-containing protein n=1 Tax=Armatimonas sp. TaxID=1872638 RepID=UPI00286A0B38|nr:beta-L-arabinofuranosidase domain-containing protein [Armatimonas sp.]